MERNLMRTCRDCGCSRCGRRNNCPNEDFACGECTPANPAWRCADYLRAPERSRDRCE